MDFMSYNAILSVLFSVNISYLPQYWHITLDW